MLLSRFFFDWFKEIDLTSLNVESFIEKDGDFFFQVPNENDKKKLLGPLAFYSVKNTAIGSIPFHKDAPKETSPRNPAKKIPSRWEESPLEIRFPFPEISKKNEKEELLKMQNFSGKDPQEAIPYKTGPRGNTITKTGRQLVRWDQNMKKAFQNAITSSPQKKKPKEILKIMMKELGDSYSYLRPRHLTIRLKQWKIQILKQPNCNLQHNNNEYFKNDNSDNNNNNIFDEKLTFHFDEQEEKENSEWNFEENLLVDPVFNHFEEFDTLEWNFENM